MELKAIQVSMNEVIANHSWEIIGHLTISLGVATMTLEDTKESLIERADRALYAAKENGRNRVTFFPPITI